LNLNGILKRNIDPSNPSNVYACLRTIDAFGIQNVDIITQSNQYRGKAAIYQKRNMRTAMGSAKWMTITNHVSTEDAVRIIREQHNCRMFASDLNPNAIDIRTIDWSNPKHSSHTNQKHCDDNDRPICIVMGNEDSGISDAMRQLVDVTFTLPMVGFAESFNLSVATAIVLAHLSAMSLQQNDQDGTSESATTITDATQKKQKWSGPIRPGDLPEDEYNLLYLKALINSLPQKRMARGMLKTAGVTLPKALNI
jgi:tRNA C32,U32 (ribose-2'-O)-methylase TrmJ